MSNKTICRTFLLEAVDKHYENIHLVQHDAFAKCYTDKQINISITKGCIAISRQMC